METKEEMIYAGFWVRLLAFIVDILVVSFLMSVVSKIGSMEKFPIIAILILWLYFTLSINRWGTTIGGKFLGIRIYTEKMNNLSFLKASVRVFVSIAPFILYQYLRGMQHMMSPAPSPEVQMLPQLIFILLPFIMFFTKKRQMLHDLVVKSVVIDVSKKVQVDETSPNKILYRGRMVIRIIGVVLFLVVGGYILLYTSVFYMLGKQSSNSYNNSFHMKYKTNDFKDSRIIFYKKELELYSKEFIEAEGMYDIFAADTKKDLALNCIQSAIKEHNLTDWIEMGSGFRKNARNKFAISEEKIKKAKANEDWMGHHFYDYDINDVNAIESEIASIWEVDKNKNTCNKLVPASNLFDMFMVRYIPNRDEALRDYEREYKRAKPTGTLNKSFYKREVSSTTQWVRTLHNKYPNIAQEIETLKKQQAMEAKAQWEQRKQKREERKRELIWIAAEKNNLYGKKHYKNVDLNLRNSKGQTPLMIAVQQGFVKVVEEFSEGNIDINIKDNQGKTAFDYIKKSMNREKKIKNERLFEALRIVELKQLIRGKAYITKMIFDNNSTVLKIVIGGAKCESFTFPDNIECTERKKRVNHPIFSAIKSKDNKQFDRYLKEVDIDIEDPWKQSLLWAALLWRNIYVVDKLLSMGVDINQLNNMKRRTPLQNAVINKNIALLDILVKYGIETKSTDTVYLEKMKKLLKERSNFSKK